jgi:hypothetical protein
VTERAVLRPFLVIAVSALHQGIVVDVGFW